MIATECVMSPLARFSGDSRGSAGKSQEPSMNWIDSFGIGARQHRPEQMIEIGHVDVVVDHHEYFDA